MIKKLLSLFSQEVRSFETITADLKRTADELAEHAEVHAVHAANKAIEIVRLKAEEAAHGLEKARALAVSANVKRLLSHE